MIKQAKHASGGAKGRAAAFFNATTSDSTIRRCLPLIRGMALVPPEIRLTLSSAKRQKFGDFAPLAGESLEYGVNRAIIASSGKMSSRKVARELIYLSIQVFHSPIYKEGQEFMGAVAYKDSKGRLAVKYAAQADRWQYPFEKQ